MTEAPRPIALTGWGPLEGSHRGSNSFTGGAEPIPEVDVHVVIDGGLWAVAGPVRGELDQIMQLIVVEDLGGFFEPVSHDGGGVEGELRHPVLEVHDGLGLQPGVVGDEFLEGGVTT